MRPLETYFYLCSLTGSLTVVFDSYTLKSILTFGDSVPFGKQLTLVCRVVSLPYGTPPNYTWTCPNGPCEVEGYYGRKVYNEHILVVNTTSTSDGGTYTCQVTATGGQEATGSFTLTVTGMRCTTVRQNGELQCCNRYRGYVINGTQYKQMNNEDIQGTHAHCLPCNNNWQQSLDNYTSWPCSIKSINSKGSKVLFMLSMLTQMSHKQLFLPCRGNCCKQRLHPYCWISEEVITGSHKSDLQTQSHGHWLIVQLTWPVATTCISQVPVSSHITTVYTMQ